MIDEKHKKSLYSNISNIGLNSNEDGDSYISQSYI